MRRRIGRPSFLRSIGTLAPVLLFAACAEDVSEPETQTEQSLLARGGSHRFSLQIDVSPADGEAEVAAVDVSGNRPGSVTVGTFDGSVMVRGMTLTSAGDDDVFVMRANDAGRVVWFRRIGDAQAQSAADVAFDDQRHPVVAGHFMGSMDFGAGVTLTSAGSAPNVFLAKLERSGLGSWAMNIPLISGGFISVSEIALDRAANIFVTGQLEGTAEISGQPLSSGGVLSNYLVKLDPAGSLLWGKIFRGPDEQVVSLQLTHDGEPVVAQFDVRGTAFYLLRWSAEGEQVLDRAYAMAPGSFSQALHDMAVDASGNMIISGTGVLGPSPDEPIDDRQLLAVLDPQGDPICLERFDDLAVEHLAVDQAGVVFAAGRAQSILPDTPPSFAPFVAAYDEGCGELWMKQYSAGATIADLAASRSSSVFFAGTLDGTVDFGGGPLSSGSPPDLFAVSLNR
jgi:hypothetical protein